jgi:hypothetical protein
MRARKCRGYVSEGLNAPCPHCISVSCCEQLERFLDRAEDVHDHTPYEYLTDSQKETIMRRLVEKGKRLRTQVCTHVL